MGQKQTHLLLLVLAFFSLTIFAESPHPFSAARGPKEPFMRAYSRFIQGGVIKRIPGQNASAFDVKRPLTQLLQADIQQIPQWPQKWMLRKLFAHFRDERFMPDPDDGNFLRRPSWMYPDDGCFARASVFSERIALTGAVRPSKIFAFGNLHVKTANAPAGAVNWWYHVVPAIQYHGVVYVLDPAVEPNHILTLRQWVNLISPDPNGVLLSLCDSHSYQPNSPCRKPDLAEDADALVDQNLYLTYERERMTELGRNPKIELGDYPPWFFSSPY